MCPVCCAFLSHRVRLPRHSQKMCAVTIVGTVLKQIHNGPLWIGKYASENGNSKAINHFKEELPTLKESTVRTFKQAYEKRLHEEK